MQQLLMGKRRLKLKEPIMDIKTIKLNNLGRFVQLEANFAPTSQVSGNVTVFIGNNGAGKTSILKSIATSLSWFVARMRSEKGNGSPIPEIVIGKGKSYASIELTVSDPNDHTWILAKTSKGKKALISTNLHDLTNLADRYRTQLTNQPETSLPLIAFYSVERVVIDIPLKIREKHNFFQLDGYDNALNQGVDFRRFFEWFREREDSENEQSLPQDALRKILDALGDNDLARKKISELMQSSKDKQLTAVRNAIASFMPNFTNLRVRRKPRLHMSIDKDGETLNVLQLSQGEKSLMALVGDIARRLAMMNPVLENPLQGDGIVLIDEVDMHLHPTWQRSIIERLTTTFPNCQFILTSHSPLVISDCKNVLVYSIEDGELTAVPSQYGQDANTVLLDVMSTNIRNAEINQKINDLLDFIQDNQLAHARSLLAQLAAELPDNNLELIKAKMFLRKQELKHAQNN